MSVIQFPDRSDPMSQNSIVAFVDLQNEYVSEGRPFALGDSADRCIHACTELMAHARRRRLVIAHFRQHRRSACFNPATNFFDWIDNCRPYASEAVYDRSLPSIYANGSFARYVDEIEQPTIFLAGLSSDTACLASAVDAYHRGHRIVFLSDCSASPALGELNAEQAHRAATGIIGKFAELATSRHVLAELSNGIQIRKMSE